MYGYFIPWPIVRVVRFIEAPLAVARGVTDVWAASARKKRRTTG
jgi:hypothetical protein